MPDEPREDEMVHFLMAAEKLRAFPEFFLGWSPEDIKKIWPSQFPHFATVEELVVGLFKRNYIAIFQPRERLDWFPQDWSAFYRDCITSQLYGSIATTLTLPSLSSNLSSEKIERAILSELHRVVNRYYEHDTEMTITWMYLAHQLEKRGIAAMNPKQLILINQVDRLLRRAKVWQPAINEEIVFHTQWKIDSYGLQFYFPA
ncbi:hypothetical protein [Lacticaseibacillus salsurivasis]|uniref:hypothetical protein n=1 Tax=Lacticaseibacillus salsurivasis TaxID=3081441 RepID=UPI0030C781E7